MQGSLDIRGFDLRAEVSLGSSFPENPIKTAYVFVDAKENMIKSQIMPTYVVLTLGQLCL